MHLYSLAVGELDFHPDRSSRYISLIRAISKKHKVTLSSTLKRGICKECNMPLIPGRNATVRTRNAVIVITCTQCGSVKRYPFRKERASRRSLKTGFHEVKAPGGLIQASVVVSGTILRKVTLSGDFFLHPEDALVTLERNLRHAPYSEIGRIIELFFETNDIDMPGVSPGDIAAAICGAMDAVTSSSE
jgi:ribonuclease P protein subunit RPR2